MSELRTLTGLLLGLSASVLAGGCNSQAGNGYTGEPLLSIHGTVLQSGELNSDWVPALAFSMNDGGYDIVDAHVSGEFPAKFQLDFTEAPPEETFPPGPGNMPSKAWGKLVLVPPNHPKSYHPEKFTYSRTEDGQQVLPQPYCDAGSCEAWPRDTSSYVVAETYCDNNNQCATRRYDCHYDPCQTIYSSGDVNLQTAELSASQNTGYYLDDPSLADLTGITSGSGGTDLNDGRPISMQSYYDRNDINHAYRTMQLCDSPDTRPPVGGDYDPRTVRHCSRLEETGDPSVLEQTCFQEISQNIVIIYAKQDLSDQFPVPLLRGYNVVVATSSFTSTDEAVAWVNCNEDAQVTAVNEYNAANGTNVVPWDIWASGFQSAYNRGQELSAQCGDSWKSHRVANTSTEPIEIQIGTPVISPQ